ncbi:type I-E CRISPR-associated protein Cas5/CasD [Brevibacterium sp.]|uniref:type I-E CRISPR-associated protein Cas5/CasD n=1 Tax=Brevibacterium sp. TaxID=1701 RepID=UPI0025BFCB2B|nr:type I-E CRISPR-associated protein Cas5/CasD [Brevibacterium sp.]
MTSSLLLLLKGPMQSWGDASRYRDRATRPYPTKSGVLGLIAAAEGRRRTDDLEDLARLRFAVRVDQSGSVMHDYQTSEAWQTGGGTSLISRYYLADAVFLAAVESPDRQILEGIATALRTPRFPLFLGRRSCPANPDLVPRQVRRGKNSEDTAAVEPLRDVPAVQALREAPWFASNAHRRTRPKNLVLPIYRDAMPGEEQDGDPRQDVPLSFDQRHRRYGWRTVVEDETGAPIANPDGTARTDPFFEEVISA